MNVETYETREGPMQFVAIERNNFWFLKVAGGDAALKGHFNTTKIVDIIADTCDESMSEWPEEADDPRTTPKNLPQLRGAMRPIPCPSSRFVQTRQ